MTYANVPPALMRPTHHLDVAPMILALQFQPADFEYKHGQLRHVPSRHQFLFDRSGRVTIDAPCGCAGRSISSEQAEQLHCIQSLERLLLAHARNRPGVCFPFPPAERMGPAFPRYEDGLATIHAPRRSRHTTRRSHDPTRRIGRQISASRNGRFVGSPARRSLGGRRCECSRPDERECAKATFSASSLAPPPQ